MADQQCTIEAGPVESTEPVWKALSHPARRRILDLLREGPMTTGEVSARFDMSRPAVTKHLNRLTDAGLVLVRRDGRKRYNRLNAVPLRQIYERWVSRFEDRWAESLLSLKRHVEEAPVREMLEDNLTAGRVELEWRLDAPRERVWQALVSETGEWWPESFLQGDAERVVLEAELGGHFYEDWGGGDGLIWWKVLGLVEGERLELLGQLGERYGPATTYTTITLEARGESTLVTLTDTVWGAAERELESLEEGWTYLIDECLAHWLARGEPLED